MARPAKRSKEMSDINSKTRKVAPVQQTQNKLVSLSHRVDLVCDWRKGVRISGPQGSQDPGVNPGSKHMASRVIRAHSEAVYLRTYRKAELLNPGGKEEGETPGGASPGFSLSPQLRVRGRIVTTIIRKRMQPIEGEEEEESSRVNLD